MKTRMLLAFITVTLTSCAPAQTAPAVNMTDVQNIAHVIIQTGIALTLTARPTSTPQPPTITPIMIFIPTLYPTLPPPPIYTPDAIHVAHWKEYQTELAKSLLYFASKEGLIDESICEWDILGRFYQDVYVFAECIVPGKGGDGLPAVIHLNADGTVRKVEVPSHGSTWDADIQKMFPVDVIEKFDLYFGNSAFDGRRKAILDHLVYRETQPEEPPLIVLSVIPTSTPIPTATTPPTPSPRPTQTNFPTFTPDVEQLERWQEYQTALAKSILAFVPPEDVVCEWEILGRIEDVEYGWAICASTFEVGDNGQYYIWENVFILHLGMNRAIESVEIILPNTEWEIRRVLPLAVQERYFNGRINLHYRTLTEHLRWRREHPEELPLFILSATPVPTPTP